MSWTITEKSQSFRFQSHWRTDYKRYTYALTKVKNGEGTLHPNGLITLNDKDDPAWRISVHTPVTRNFCAYYSEVIWLAIKLFGLGLIFDGMIYILLDFFIFPISFGVGYNFWYSCLVFIAGVVGILGWCTLGAFIVSVILSYSLDVWVTFHDRLKSKKVKRPKKALLAVIKMWYKSRKEKICPIIDFKVQDDSFTQPKEV